MKLLTRKTTYILVLLICFSIIGYPQLFHKNSGESVSIGEYNNGSIQNSYLLPRKGTNYKCYSFLSYYILGREYIHSKAYYCIIDTYKELENIYPNHEFIYMESGRKKGGRLYPHRTHQKGLSIDFFVPLIQNSKPTYFNGFGIFRYLLNFDENGISKCNSKITIDFDVMAQHILLLEKNAKKNGLHIKKVIFNIDLKDNLFETKHGKLLKKSEIYFAQNLTPLLNKLHDDHYHIDFEEIK